MAIDVKCRVEVFCEKNLAIFDFGDFGIIIEYDSIANSHEFTVDSGSNYITNFMGFWVPVINNRPVDVVEISLEAFEEIKRFFSQWKKAPSSKLLALLQKNFPEQIKLYYQ